VLLFVGSACSDDEDTAKVGVRDDPGPVSTLTVTVAADAKGTALRTWSLTCEPAGGDHPDPAAACRALTALKRPFEPVPADAICTEIYGGSAVATLKGTWRGTPVDATYTRENGCHISRYDALGATLPGPVPGQPSP
jgi:hypothetical protein